MNNDELKKKIAKIIDTTEKPCNCLTVSECLAKTGCKYHNRNDGTTCFSYARAEALIAAGIGDVKELENEAIAAELVAQASASTAIEKIEEWKHRAEVYKRALHIAHTAGEFAYYVDKAEKELAEERKDENN